MQRSITGSSPADVRRTSAATPAGRLQVLAQLRSSPADVARQK